MTDGPLRIDRRDDGIVVLTLALPDRRNAMTAELTAAWRDTIAGLRGDRSVRCVVVTGEGSAFCAGGDLSWIAESPDMTVDSIRDRMLPFYRTCERLLTGRAVQDDEALRIGLLNGVFEGARFLDDVLEVAGRIAGAAPIATRLTKAGLRTGGHASIEDALQYEALAQPVTFATDDLREGLAASRERRRPDFSGR